MRPVARTLAAVACGFAAGLAIGPSSVLMAAASDVWVRGWAWPKFDSNFLLLLLVTSIPAGVNGAVGAGLAAARGRLRRLDITWLPAGLHAVAAVVALVGLPFLVGQLYALMFAVVVWPAGRLGQSIGSAFHPPGVGPQTPNRLMSPPT